MLEVAIAPEGALVRVSQAINRPKRRSLGIFKMENEFVGVVADGGFEIWERGQRAVHARAQVRARRGGTRIELRFLLPVYTRVLVVLFFVLYAAVAAGIALLPPDRSLSIEELLLTVAGASVLAAIFRIAARRQRADLRTFVESLFKDVPRL